MNWEKEKENLIKLLVKEKLPYTKVGKQYNISGNGIKKVCKRLNINIPPRRLINPSETFNRKEKSGKICKNCKKNFYSHSSSRIYCSKKCASEYRSKEKYKEYLQKPDLYYKQSSMKWIKKYILKEQKNRCAICNCEPIWNNKPLVFILDHINGKANDNRRNNLRLVCPNCDSQLDTYKSKNKNSDRTYYHNHHR